MATPSWFFNKITKVGTVSHGQKLKMSPCTKVGTVSHGQKLKMSPCTKV